MLTSVKDRRPSEKGAIGVELAYEEEIAKRTKAQEALNS
jgi:hypothetical protein